MFILQLKTKKLKRLKKTVLIFCKEVNKSQI